MKARQAGFPGLSGAPPVRSTMTARQDRQTVDDQAARGRTPGRLAAIGSYGALFTRPMISSVMSMDEAR